MTLHCRQCGIHIGLWYLHMRPIDDDYCAGCKEKKSTRLRREIAEAERLADGGTLWNPRTDWEVETLDEIYR